jgi:transcriptional regulator with XRE-family HTH domain
MAKRRESAGAERRRERWRQTLRRWRASGLSQAEFCRRRGIPVSRLSWWKRRLSGEAVGPPGEFILLGVLQRPSQARRLEVVLGNGRRLRFSLEVDPERLAYLAAALEAAEVPGQGGASVDGEGGRC